MSPAPGQLLSPRPHIRAIPKPLCPRASKRKEAPFLLSPWAFSHPLCTRSWGTQDFPESLGSYSCTSQATSAKSRSGLSPPRPGGCPSPAGSLLQFFIGSFITNVEIAARWGPVCRGFSIGFSGQPFKSRTVLKMHQPQGVSFWSCCGKVRWAFPMELFQQECVCSWPEPAGARSPGPWWHLLPNPGCPQHHGGRQGPVPGEQASPKT